MRKYTVTMALALLALPMLCLEAEASCSGSGITWNCTAGTTSAELGTALGSASDGATLTFANGSYTWDTWISFNNTRGATLICATIGGCNVTANATVLGMNGNLSGTNTKLYRISGFNFSGTFSPAIWFYGCGAYGSTCPLGIGGMTQLRIDNNTFNYTGSSTGFAINLAEFNTIGNDISGVIDHNTVLSSASYGLMYYTGGVNPNTPPPAPLGTANNIFIEDNTVTNTAETNIGQGCIDDLTGNIVFRHNTTTNCTVTSHGALARGGPQNYEFYNNTTTANANAGVNARDGYRLFHHQGSGEFIAFNNIFTAPSGHTSNTTMTMLYYRDEATIAAGSGGTVCDGTQSIDGNRLPVTTYRGYPCWHQPARDFAGNLKPMYAWGNKWSDTNAQVNLTQEDYGGFFAQHWGTPNRDAFNAVGLAQTSASSPFNGTTGMGYGTLANRPTTCSTGNTDPPDAGNGGVGYFATDVGTQGTLYQCSSTNTWVAWYTPYPYPHPLVSGSPPPPPPPPPSSVPGITLKGAQNGTVGTPFSYTIVASNSPTSFNATTTNGLPPGGLSINSATGVLSGTPTTAGTYAITLSATNAKGTGSAPLTLTINAASTNIATTGTAYRWFGMTTATANSNKTAAPGLNDTNLTTDVQLTTGSVADIANGYEAAGVVWSSNQSLNKATFTNGSFTPGADGVFDNNISVQGTTDGSNWSVVNGWTMSPAYPYNLSAAGGQTYTFSGPAISVRGIRVAGQVRSAPTNPDSWFDNATEIQAFGPTPPCN